MKVSSIVNLTLSRRIYEYSVTSKKLDLSFIVTSNATYFRSCDTHRRSVMKVNECNRAPLPFCLHGDMPLKHDRMKQTI